MDEEKKYRLEELARQAEREYREKLELLIGELFPDSSRDQVLELLQEFERSARVKLAVVKLSGGNLDKLKQMSAEAKRDYRNVLYWAEYPERPEEARRILLALGRWLIEQGRAEEGDKLTRKADELAADDEASG